MFKPSPCAYYLYPVLILTLTTGCAFLQNQEKLLKEKETIALKKEKYEDLHAKITAHALQKGTSLQTIKKSFGEPDDIFQSASATGSFQVWTYEKVMDKKDEESWQPIRLYFDNNKLVSWNY